MPGRPLPPPQQLTAQDVARLALGAIMIPLGAVILYRTLLIAFSFQAILVGVAFIAFGLYRLALGWSRYRLLRQATGQGLPRQRT